MAAHQLTRLGDEIFLVEGLLDPSLCQHLIQIAETCEFQAAGILIESVDNEVRSNDMLKLGQSNPLGDSTNQLIMMRLAIAQGLLFESYGVRFPYAEPCTILRYREGQFYKRHVDNLLLSSRFQEVEQGIPTRDISVVGYLNDGFEGGETYFDRQGVTVQPQAGAVLLFPAYFTHPHASLPVRKGQKYAFTSWLFH
ncbi:MAG: 2OG-Fe(II) oxygenase [Leptolyngbya sp. DLM2.Bin15]|uniref:prolyl hydroxylase family protein n=1 Tax=Leptolyngbya sp. CCY15150 TaxID=2767772 RepID=UPI001381AD40|nr:2OG-Fe(II) oxygenase [Leptolyngbya sp. CCY15150]MBF2088205.1 2OG-Fe(II) oxygenase [Synechococcales cyanobacterium K32_A2020_035]MBF2095333.1 2OG-Fe(II) oxygenase [Synechococcales cyanobacterium K44_A2020_017]TVQ19710.1 MAG: 2OG-Fe(II) oxygenase [Leptolyngbya sp. DLM2.Bin15]